MDDAAWLARQVRDLTEMMEGAYPKPWAVDDAPAPYIDAQIRGIVGIEIAITAMMGKWKVSQNRSDSDVEGVIEGLRAQSDEEANAMAALVEARQLRGRQDAERRQRHVEVAGRIHRDLVLRGDFRGVGDMVAVAVRDQHEVDLADLAEILEFGRRQRAAHDPRIDDDHLAAGRGELEARLAVPQQLGLSLRACDTREGETGRDRNTQKTKDHSQLPIRDFCQQYIVFRSERAHFPVSRRSLRCSAT